MIHYRVVLLASVVLLPLLGLTWAFGVLNVNKNTMVFAWLFTIFNSLQVHNSSQLCIGMNHNYYLQGLFLFFFHVLRSEMVHNNIVCINSDKHYSSNYINHSVSANHYMCCRIMNKLDHRQCTVHVVVHACGQLVHVPACSQFQIIITSSCN